SPVAATNQQGQVIWRETYKPHGQRTTNATASANNKVWFTGKQEESALGINYFGARWYHPEVGRFLVIDPVGVAPGNIHGFNRYSYANNNPYAYVDPDGREAACVSTGGCNLQITPGRVAIVAGIAGFVPVLGDGLAIGQAIQNPSLGNILGAGIGIVPVVGDAAGGMLRGADDVAKQLPDITAAYRRPSGATTAEQRASVQGKPCVDCGSVTSKQVADHKTPLVKEYYEKGAIDTQKMRSPDAVQPQCPTCSARQGAEMSRFSRQQKKDRGL